eukprot:scaffold58967_cov56-Phaeocystis_antarctica.AAC.2
MDRASVRPSSPPSRDETAPETARATRRPRARDRPVRALSLPAASCVCGLCACIVRAQLQKACGGEPTERVTYGFIFLLDIRLTAARDSTNIEYV